MANAMGDETQPVLLKSDYWSVENLKYSEPHFRLYKYARIIKRLTKGHAVDLLDIGCGPGALAQLLPKSVRYHGIDIAIQEPASNLIEADFVDGEIAFRGMEFDIAVASGIFEYVGTKQVRKFAEIHSLLKKSGWFVLSYINFDHIHRVVYPNYNNVQPFGDFKNDLQKFFDVRRCFPVSYNWMGTTPQRRWLKYVQRQMYFNVPVVGHRLAVEYFFVCQPR